MGINGREDAPSGSLPEGSVLFHAMPIVNTAHHATAITTQRPVAAVVPAAGFGTRLRPLTNAIPKEMLPVGGRLALEWILEELAAAGLSEAVLVLSPAKEPLIRGYFGDQAAGLTLRYALQPEMRGLGDAILQAEGLLDSERPFVVALGDAIFAEPTAGGLTRRLCDSFVSSNAGAGLAVQKVERERLSRYGVVRPAEGASLERDAFSITDIVEKPTPEDAPSDFAAAARYVALPSIFQVLRETPPGKGGEIQFTDALRTQLAGGVPGIAVPLAAGEVRHDIGSIDSYYRAFAAFALADADNGPAFRKYLQQRI